MALSYEEARRAYDRIGALQDSQAFYEDRATDVVLRHGRWDTAEAVFELGCGTGRFARRLLAEQLPRDARYRGVDVSPKMVSIAQPRLAEFGSRARVTLTDGAPPADEPAASCDRFVSSYVLDLLSDADIAAVVREAHRMLRPGGLLCLTSLCGGVGPLSRGVARAWGWIQAKRPAWVGGCRPIELTSFLDEASWRVLHDVRIVAFGVPSEAVVAERVEPGGA